MVELYVRLLNEGKRTIKQVPSQYQEEVLAKLNV